MSDPVSATYGLPPRARDRDHCSAAGAAALARRIRAYWAERGAEPLVWVEVVAKVGDHNTLYGLRSDLLNGAPSHRSPASTRSARAITPAR